MRQILIPILAAGCLLAADEPKQNAQVTKTQTVPFTATGTLVLKHSVGDLSIEGWDRTEVEIRTIAPMQIRIQAQRQGDELNVTTDYPRHRALSRPFRESPMLDVQYEIKVPRNTKVIVEHEDGGVYVSDVSADIRITVREGQIGLRLPEGEYAIDARTKFGGVVSDFTGRERRKPWLIGHGFITEGTSASAHSLFLRAGYGDIEILKLLKPRVEAAPK